MKPYTIVKYPNVILTQECHRVPDDMFGTRKLKEIVARMTITMMRQNGVGLAANQVGMSRQIIVINTLDFPNGFMGAMINPIILERSDGTAVGSEGCLSFPGENVFVHRNETVKVQYQTQTGEIKVVELKGMSAVCVQHEIDHLLGITMKDRV